jgi:hypothetical protein
MVSFVALIIEAMAKVFFGGGQSAIACRVFIDET